MFKRIIQLTLCGVVCFLFVFGLPVSAHQTKSDGTISAILHVNPDDDPIIGEPSRIGIEIKDKTKQFKFEECDCRVYVKTAAGMLFGKSISDKEIVFMGRDTVSFEYIFKSKGIYTIELVGNPTAKASFEKFDFSYDIRVERTPGTQSSLKNQFLNHYQHYIIFIFGILSVLFLIVADKFEKKRYNKR